MWMKASSASITTNTTMVTINSGESMANIVAGDAAILGDKPPVEVADSAQINGQWQLSLQDPWPYESVNDVALRVQPNGSRFDNAIGAMRRTNTTANNILAGMRDWLTSSNKTITVSDANGQEYVVPTLANLGSAAERNVGTSDGNLMEVGAFGLGQENAVVVPDNSLNNVHYNSFCRNNRDIDTLNAPADARYAYCLLNFRLSEKYGAQIVASPSGAFPSDRNLRFWARVEVNGEWGNYAELYHSLNTTIDSNGFIKSASPIVKLYANHVETNELSEGAELYKKGTGEYSISGTGGIAQEGWYIETPKDMNGNIKVFVEFSQSADADGAPLLQLRTFTPDYRSGFVQPGSPVDIPEGRFITLRCAERQK